MKNIKGLFADVRTRTIIVITAILLIGGIGIGYYIFRQAAQGPTTQAELEQTPAGIQSIPGSFQPTAQYAKLQEEENTRRAQEAEKSGSSAIPTIIRATRPGAGTAGRAVSGQPWEAGLGYQALARVEATGNAPKELALEAVKRHSCSKKSLEKARSLGATVEELREAGCTARQMRAAGFTPDELQKAGYSACELLSSNDINPKALKNAGYTAGELRGVGFNACQLRNAGYTASELRKAGFTPEELKGVGFVPAEISAAGYTPGQMAGQAAAFSSLPTGLNAEALRARGCNPGAVELANIEGVSAATMRNVVGCNAAELKAGGYTAKQLRGAGFTAGQLLAAGFTPEELKKAGYTSGDLLLAGLSPEQVKKLGYTPAEIQAGENEVQALGLPPGTTLSDLRQAGCGVAAVQKARQEGVSAKAMRDIGCTASQLKAGGYTATELKAAGFSAAELKRAGFSAAELKTAGFTAKQLRDVGFTAGQLKAAGYTVGELKRAGFSAAQLRAAGFTAKALKDAGYTASEMKAAGFTPEELAKAGYTAKQLKDAGFTAAELKNAGFSAAQLKNAGFSTQALKGAGFSAAQLVSAGYSPAQLRAAGYSARAIQNAGYSPADLSAAGISPGIAAQPGRTAEITPPQSEEDKQLAAAQAQQTAQIKQQQLQQLEQDVASAMNTQASQLFTAWRPVAQQYVPGEPPKGPGQTAAGGAFGQQGQQGSLGRDAASASTAPTMIKAGKIMFAVLQTAVDSDYPGPVLAKLVSGKYTGATLIGALTTFRTGKKVMLTFNLMNYKNFTQAIPIAAVAIDPNTARTALSSYTNNHYLLRYGSLFAASFMEGYGQAFLQSGQTVIQTPSSTSITSPDLSPSGKIYAALGNVGNKFGSALEDVYDMRPTVHVYSGTGLGILFLTDVAQPRTISTP